jgi:hypothetical protein
MAAASLLALAGCAPVMSPVGDADPGLYGYDSGLSDDWFYDSYYGLDDPWWDADWPDDPAYVGYYDRFDDDDWFYDSYDAVDVGPFDARGRAGGGAMTTQTMGAAGLAVALAAAPSVAAAEQRGGSMQERAESGRGMSSATAAPGRSVEGVVDRRKEVRLRRSDVRHDVVLLRSGDRAVVVDLGPVRNLSDAGIRPEKGTRLKAEGPIRRVGDRAVLFAERVSQGDNSVTVDRSGLPERAPSAGGLALGEERRITGKIVQTKDVRSRQGSATTVVLLERPNGVHVPVDVGSARALDMNLDVGRTITVEGAPIRSGDRIVLEAEEVRSGDRVAQVERATRG